MFRKLLTIFLLLGLLTSVVAWVAQARKPIVIYGSSVPENLLRNKPAVVSILSESNWRLVHSEAMRSPMSACGFNSVAGFPQGKTQKVTRVIGCALLAQGMLTVRIGTRTLITDDQDSSYLGFGCSYPANRTCRIPIWSIALVCALASGLLTVLPVLRRRKRARRGQCLHCGYDLRGSTERCPECGTEFDADRLMLTAES